MAWGRRGDPGHSPWQDPDWLHAMNDYSAAQRDEPTAEPFAMADWRDDQAGPTHPAWSCQGCELHPAPEPPPPPGPVDDGWAGYDPALRPGGWW
jgi:hypothetical protein